MNIKVRLATVKHYLYVYNVQLRYARNAELIRRLTDWINAQWDTFSGAQRRFILARELW